MGNSRIQTAPLLKPRQWQDLLAYKPWEVAYELSLPLPWFALAIWASNQTVYILTLLASGYFFLACGRVAHNAFHYSLGISKVATDLVMLLLSIAMLTSMHATQTTHLIHHRHCMKDNDIEGQIARLSFFKMLVNAPLLTLRLHIGALKQAKKIQLRWIWSELVLNLVWLIAVWFYWESDALRIHTLIMLFSHAISPFFTIWSVHHDCDIDKRTSNQYISRTIRSRWLSLLSYKMYFHLEHHAYPAVPTCHWPELARRMDRVGLKNYKTVL